MPIKVYLSLGSNYGDRKSLIKSALGHISSIGPVRVSSAFRSRPSGFESENEFVNVGAILTLGQTDALSESDAERLLERFKAIERRLSDMPHRNADGSYRDREIDIDIVAVDGLRMESPTLVLPHPLARQRDFVVRPLEELGVDTAALFDGADKP